MPDAARPYINIVHVRREKERGFHLEEGRGGGRKGQTSGGALAVCDIGASRQKLDRLFCSSSRAQSVST